MKLFVLFGHRHETYKNQYGVEALSCMTEYDMDENGSYLYDEKAKYILTGDFQSLEIVAIDVNEAELMKIMNPVKELEGKVF